MAYAISWNMDEGQKNSVFLCLNNRLCESRYLLHVCCVMSHKTITCECEGESLVTVTCYEISDLRDVTVAALWRRQVTQAVDITHPMLVMIPVLSCAHLHLISHYWVLTLCCPLLASGHMSQLTPLTLPYVCWLSIQVRLRSRLSSSLLPLSSPVSRLPGQAVVCPAHSRPGRNSQGTMKLSG